MNAKFIPWKRYNIFISSTFKDMDFERNAIKFNVIPQLNKKFRERHIEFRAIDLRMGINTAEISEDESERKVLSTCISSIDSSRPFFIGLIGARYGWIPPQQRWNEFYAMLRLNEKKALAETQGCSVTEIEIAYGALSEQSLSESHALFFFRDNDSYDLLPEQRRADFIDEDSDLVNHMDNLKKTIVKTLANKGGDDDRCFEYHLDYNPSLGTFQSDSFADMLLNHIAAQVELECPSEGREQKWWKQDSMETIAQLMRINDNAAPCGISLYEDQRFRQGMFISGAPGEGKSTLLAQLFNQSTKDSNRINLCAIIGFGTKNYSMREVIVRWIMELSEYTKTSMPDDKQLLDTSYPDIKVYDSFFELVDKVIKSGREVWAFIDNVDELALLNPSDLEFSWMRRDINIVLAAEKDTCMQINEMHQWLPVFPVKKLRAKLHRISKLYQRMYYMELPSGAKTSTISTPLQLRGIFNLIQCASQQDLNRVRTVESDTAVAINEYILEQWHAMPAKALEIRNYLSDALIDAMGLSSEWKMVLKLLDSSYTGLRESDIENFLGTHWNVIDFHRLMNYMVDFYREDIVDHIWRPCYPEASDVSNMEKLAVYCDSLPDDDYLHEKAGAYYVISSGRTDLIGAYLIPDMDHFEVMQPRMQLCHTLLCAKNFINNGSLASFCATLDDSIKIPLVFHLFNADYGNTAVLEENLNTYLKICRSADFDTLDTNICLMAALVLKKSTRKKDKNIAKVVFKRCIAENGPHWHDVEMHLIQLDPEEARAIPQKQEPENLQDFCTAMLQLHEEAKRITDDEEAKQIYNRHMELCNKVLVNKRDDKYKAVAVKICIYAADVASHHELWCESLFACDRALSIWGERLEAVSDNGVGLILLFQTFHLLKTACELLYFNGDSDKIPRRSSDVKELSEIIDLPKAWVATRVYRENPNSALAIALMNNGDKDLLRSIEMGEYVGNPVVEKADSIHALVKKILNASD